MDESQHYCAEWEKRDVKTYCRDFPGGPEVKTASSQCRGYQFDLWLGNYDPTCHKAQPHKIKNKNGEGDNTVQ